MYCFQNQMWLDGLYMAGPISVRYGLMENKRVYIETIHKQLELMWENIRDKQTGLLYHAWDESGKAEWASPENGCSPEMRTACEMAKRIAVSYHKAGRYYRFLPFR